MNIEVFAQAMAEICSHACIAPGRPLRWTIIANPKAGGFTIPSRWKKSRGALEAASAKAALLPLRVGAAPSETGQKAGNPGSGLGLAATGGSGDAEKIACALGEEALHSGDEGGGKPFHLLITAGGDGTSLEAQSAFYAFPRELRSGFALLRLPMGTGNDGADAWDLGAALEKLLSPARIEYQRALRLRTSTPGKGPFLAFNILSIGADAFVTHMTNKMKGKLPGDSYKLWVDMAALFYDRLYKSLPMEVRAFDEAGGLAGEFREKVLLLAMGASGGRTYGSHVRILPDSRNVCMVRQTPLFRKLALKNLFNTGGHTGEKEVSMMNASRLEIQGEAPILAQMDGETVLLKPEDYPAVIELTEPAIPVLKN